MLAVMLATHSAERGLSGYLGYTFGGSLVSPQVEGCASFGDGPADVHLWEGHRWRVVKRLTRDHVGRVLLSSRHSSVLTYSSSGILSG